MKKLFLFLAVILINLSLRIYISINTPHQGDILTQQEWANTLTNQGLAGSYFSQGWTYSPPTQPPLMMLAYSGSGWLYQNRNIFSAMHNFIKFPTAAMLLGFQKYGQTLSLKIWETIGTYFIALVFFFYLSKKNSFKKSFLCFLFIIFNPISIFINSVWGQNDILPTAFMYLAFIFVFSKFIFISPIFFVIGILFKPTIITLIPLFAFIFLYQAFKKKAPHRIVNTIFSGLICLGLIYFSFKPFIPSEIKPLGYINDIVNSRIKTSSKGLKLASVSAFNFYSLFWNIDKTYATHDGSLIQLKDVATILIILINFFFIFKLYKSKKINFDNTLFTIFFISQGSFLFMTNMLERYFIPAFLSSIVLLVIYWKKFGLYFLVQNLIWLINIIYAYYYRNNDFINHLFHDYNNLLIRLLSLANLLLFLFITKTYFKSFLTRPLKSLDK